MLNLDQNSLTLPNGILLEGIVTTLNEYGTPNIAPMGPIVDANFDRLLLPAISNLDSYQNLKRTGEGVLHVTDDVELLAHAAVGTLDPLPPTYAGSGSGRRDPRRCLPLVRFSCRIAR